METKIKSIRIQKNLSLKKASEMCKMPQAQYTRIERGEVSPQLVSLQKIAQGFNVQVRDLLLEQSNQRKGVVFCFNKGGVGKSTLSLLTAQLISNLGYNVVFLDNDPQASSTQWFLNNVTDDQDYQKMYSQLISHNIYTLMRGDSLLDQCLIEIPGNSLKLIGATPLYEEAKSRFRGAPGADNLQKVALENLYCDYLIVDTPGELSEITNWGLSLASIVIIPVETSMFAAEALPVVMSRVEMAKKFLNLNIQDVHVIPNKFKPFLRRDT